MVALSGTFRMNSSARYGCEGNEWRVGFNLFEENDSRSELDGSRHFAPGGDARGYQNGPRSRTETMADVMQGLTPRPGDNGWSAPPTLKPRDANCPYVTHIGKKTVNWK